jgi:hypothetical protein
MNVDCSIQMMNGCVYKDNWDFEANEFKEIHDYITNTIQNETIIPNYVCQRQSFSPSFYTLGMYEIVQEFFGSSRPIFKSLHMKNLMVHNTNIMFLT